MAVARGSLPTKPSRKAFSAGSWVKWTGTNGRDYQGIVSTDRATLHQVTGEVATGSRSARVKVVIIPADGSDALPLALPNANHWKAEAKQAGRWIQVQRMDMGGGSVSTQVELYGPVGEAVRTVAPKVETDPVGIYMATLSLWSAAISGTVTVEGRAPLCGPPWWPKTGRGKGTALVRPST